MAIRPVDDAMCFSRSATKPSPLCGSVSRPSMKQCTKVFSIPYSAAMSHSLNRWSSDECTPPSDVRPMKWTFAPFALAYSNALTISGLRMIELSRQARLIFTRS